MIIRSFAGFAGGMAVNSLVDKFIPDKLPAGVAPISPANDKTGKFNWMKFLTVAVIGGIGVWLVSVIGKKLNIKILK